MKKIVVVASLSALVVAVYSCKKNSNNSTGPASQSVVLDLPATTEKFFDNIGTTNDSLNRVATLGKVLFYDGHLSANNAISCGSCHKQAFGFADNTAFSTGFEGHLTGRNSPGIAQIGNMSATPLFWDGRENNLQNLILRPITNHVEMGIEDASVLPGKLAEQPYYAKLFKDAFRDENITLPRISFAMSTFITAIGQSSVKTRFDLYQAGNKSVLTPQEIEGNVLFDTKYNCGSCHKGNNGYGGSFSFKDIGLDNQPTDIGRAAITGLSQDKGTFKVPNLRNVAITGPYMHDGRFKTLGEVIDHYSHDIRYSQNLDPIFRDSENNPKSFNITDHDKEAIIAFLGTLTDYTTATDPKFANPFKLK